VPPAASSTLAAAKRTPVDAVVEHEAKAQPSGGDSFEVDNGSSGSATHDDALTAYQPSSSPSDSESTADEDEVAESVSFGAPSPLDIDSSVREEVAVVAQKTATSPIDVDGLDEEEDAMATHRRAAPPIDVDGLEEEVLMAAHKAPKSPINVDGSEEEEVAVAVHKAVTSPIDVDGSEEEEDAMATHQRAPPIDVDGLEEEDASWGWEVPGSTPAAHFCMSGSSHVASAPAPGSRLCSRRVWCECPAPGRCATDECPCFACDRECDPDACWSCGAHWDPATGVDGEQPFGGVGRQRLALVRTVGVLAADDPVVGGVAGSRRCRNVQLQVGLRVRLVLGRSDAHGFGVFAAERASQGDFVGEYVGEMVTHHDAHARGRVYDAFGVSYLYTLTRSLVLDASRVGSRLRYVNHSRVRANLQPKLLSICGYMRVELFALRDLFPGEELFFDYGYEEDGWRE